MPSDRPRANQPLLPSVLDRLIDESPGVSQEPPLHVTHVLRELKRSVRRDLEDLLNTRWRGSPLPEHLQELPGSLVNYGIPNFNGTHLQAAQDPDVLTRVIAEAIERFEPRLKQVRVEVLGSNQPLDRTLRFRIEAVLRVDPIEDRVLFNSTIDPSTGNIQVEGNAR